MERIINDLQSEESNTGVNSKVINKNKKRSNSKQPRAKSAGKKKTMSTSPKCKSNNYELSSLISIGSKGPKNYDQSLNSNSAASGGNAQMLM